MKTKTPLMLLGTLAAGLCLGTVTAPSRAQGATGFERIETLLGRIADSLQEISHGVDEKTVCECRCK